MKKLLVILSFLVITSLNLTANNPMARALQKATKTKKSNPSKQKKARKTTDTQQVPGKIVTVNIINKSKKKAALIKNITMKYLPPNTDSTKDLESLSVATTSKRLQKRFTIPAYRSANPQKISATLSLSLEPGSSYAGISELIIGNNNQAVPVDASFWSTTNNSTSSGGWIADVIGSPSAIYIDYVDNKWILDTKEMKKSAQENMPANTPTTPLKNPVTVKTTSDTSTSKHATVLAMHNKNKSKIKTKKNVKDKQKSSPSHSKTSSKKS